jgi:hypothetical protein
MVSSAAFAFLTGNFAFSAEFQAFFMALQGAMKVRSGANKDGKLNWFYAFCQGVVLSYAGALFAPLWMGRPTSMLSSDLNMASCIIAYVLVNSIPFDIGYKVSSLFPVRLVTVMGAQLFRTMGILKFAEIAFMAFKDSPSKYYPTPVFGPILNATILGNMGSFFALGFDGHLKGGMPLPFQNGLFIASLYHFIVNDQEGPIGGYLRSALEPVILALGLTHENFAILFASVFMQTWAILQLPEFIGPTFNPFSCVLSKVKSQRKKTASSTLSTTGKVVESSSPKKKKKKKKSKPKKKND